MNQFSKSLQIIPVLDLQGGQAVHAVRGNRANYQPLTGKYAPSPDPDAILRALESLVPTRVAYVADLDAIQGNGNNLQLLQCSLQRGWTIWLDSGLRDEIPASLPPKFVPIVGTETVRSPAALKKILSCRVDCMVSVDLREGAPIHAPGCQWPAESAFQLATRVVGLGAQRLILLDLAVVGSSEGPAHLELAREIRKAFPQVDLYLGGGIRGTTDLMACQQAGITGVLVATALQSGTLTSWITG